MSGDELAMRIGLSKILDPYDLTARLLPGLLVLLPAILCIAVLYGAKSPIAIALASVLGACGGPYLLSSFVRTRGQRAQDRLFRQWGGQPTTLLLRQVIRRDDYVAQTDYDFTPARHRRDIALADVNHQAPTDRSRQRRVAAMGRVLALDVSHNGHLLSDGANVSKLALIGCSVCERGWPFALHNCPTNATSVLG